MSSNRQDKPAAGSNPGQPYNRGSSDRARPVPGEVFVRTSGGSALLTQTKSLFKRLMKG